MNSLLFSSDTFCWKLKNNEIFCPGARRLRFIPFVPRLQSFLSLQSRTVSRVAEKQSSQQSWGCLSHKQKRARARWQLVYDWSISLEYQIYLPAIDTTVTGMASRVIEKQNRQQSIVRLPDWHFFLATKCYRVDTILALIWFRPYWARSIITSHTCSNQKKFVWCCQTSACGQSAISKWLSVTLVKSPLRGGQVGRWVGAKVATFEGGARAWPLISLSKASSLNAFASTMPDNLARQVAC